MQIVCAACVFVAAYAWRRQFVRRSTPSLGGSVGYRDGKLTSLLVFVGLMHIWAALLFVFSDPLLQVKRERGLVNDIVAASTRNAFGVFEVNSVEEGLKMVPALAMVLSFWTVVVVTVSLAVVGVAMLLWRGAAGASKVFLGPVRSACRSGKKTKVE